LKSIIYISGDHVHVTTHPGRQKN